MMKIGILDFGHEKSWNNSLVRLSNVFNFAIRADELGYERFWLSEHHTFNRRLTWGNPISLIPVIAGFTSRIKVGTGGILLRIHDPLDVAAQFKLWNNIYQGRIDLGLANGGSFSSEMLRIANFQNETFDDRLENLVEYLVQEEKLFQKQIILPPYCGNTPDIWTLTTSSKGFYRSLKHGLHHVRSIFHEKADIDPNFEGTTQFKKEFEKLHHKKVKTILAVSGTCLKNERKLREIHQGSASGEQKHLIGGQSFFRDKLPELIDQYQADEILFRVMNTDQKEKLETIELLAELIND